MSDAPPRDPGVAAPRIGVAETMARLAPPVFDDLEEERRHRKQRLAAGFRLLARHGLTTGIAGHITARDPEHADHFWVNPLSAPFSKIRASDLLLVNHAGEVLEGDDVVNAAAFAIHSRIHRANPAVNAACHSHAPWGRPWSATGRMVEPTSQDACAFFRAQALVGDFRGVVLDLDTGERLGNAFRDSTDAPAGVTVAIHANHGHITVGETVDEAVFWFILFEQLCASQMRLEATGRPYHVLDADVAASTAAQVGTHYAGWLGFQGMYREILAEQPDLLD
jgi:ribulose-5-phosphate 4-epimerase/fuculose-1-phosphate aldolase